MTRIPCPSEAWDAYYDAQEYPCEVCGGESGDCYCPECPTCGEAGRLACEAEHGVTFPVRVCGACEGRGAVLEVLNDWYPGGDVIAPEYGGPMVCGSCGGRGKRLAHYPVRRSIADPGRELTTSEAYYEDALGDVERLWEECARAYCEHCKGHGHDAVNCPVLDAQWRREWE